LVVFRSKTTTRTYHKYNEKLENNQISRRYTPVNNWVFVFLITLNTNVTEVDLENLEKGLYFVYLENGEGIFLEKLIIDFNGFTVYRSP